jgi:hypothetical protein
MGDRNEARAWRYEVSDSFEDGAIGVGVEVCKTNNYAETVTKLVEGRKQARMLVIGGDDFISRVPIDTETDDI